MPLMGRISDRTGHRTAFLGALAVFSLGSIGVALSPSLPGWIAGQEPQFSWMVGARIFQAIGGGAAIPIALAAAAVLVPADRRPIAYGLVGASAEAGGVIGPLCGGAITDWLSWEWAFWLNIPPAVIVALFVLRTPLAKGHPVRTDWIGGALFAAALALTTVALSKSGGPGIVFAWTLGGSGITTAALVWLQVRKAEPLIPRHLIANLNFVWGSAAHLFVGAALIIAMVSVPLMANTLLEDTPLEGGLRLLRMTIAVGAGALAGGFATQRLGPRAPAMAGLMLASGGFIAMSRWTLDVADPWMTVHLGVTGLGFGLLVAPVAESALHRVPAADKGAASAMLTVGRMVGMTAGLAALTAWGTLRFEDLVAGSPALSTDPAVQEQIVETASQAGLTVFRGFFVAAAAICAACVAPVLLMTRGYVASHR
jgi:MFS family permease